MKIPKKPSASPEAIDAFISGATGEGQNIPQAPKPAAPAVEPAPVKTRKKPVRMKEVVTRQTFVMNAGIVEKLEAYAFWNRMSKKAVLEAALTQFYLDKKIRPIPRQQ